MSCFRMTFRGLRESIFLFSVLFDCSKIPSPIYTPYVISFIMEWINNHFSALIILESIRSSIRESSFPFVNCYNNRQSCVFMFPWGSNPLSSFTQTNTLIVEIFEKKVLNFENLYFYINYNCLISITNPNSLNVHTWLYHFI